MLNNSTVLKGKHIILGITGSIAAYKSAILCRLLRNAQAEVRVVMTANAKHFITPLTMATLSKNPILVEFFNPENGEWNSHISLGEWADLLLIAPATANTIAKMAHGIADNLLLTTYLSARCQTVVAPAMDCDMFSHPSTRENILTLTKRGVIILDSPKGELASGLEGKGRMAEPESIVNSIEDLFTKNDSILSGRRFLVTAGPTREAIDPIRFISNTSTGKMGYAIAKSLVNRGAEVVLISGPTSLEAPKGCRVVHVTSAQEMYKACVNEFKSVDGAVMCAAVADYTPSKVSNQKIKKTDDDLQIPLKRTEDIAKKLGKEKGKRILVGFALETNNGIEHAKKKLQEKNLDFIVYNSAKEEGAGPQSDTNIVTIIDDECEKPYPILSKADVAEIITQNIERILLKNA
ncbi:MAG: bifunctional phosphopantothenoylcysteine decarboxylase/phosphopantothenate--cysteine ligase CoaBC [Alistipes sp.]|nr:bifunctional phosphopantothenoylcysteine decarboxylase/phosphopantothenate--cysteine ligase CoaBC [Candidatus Alistipes equi]